MKESRGDKKTYAMLECRSFDSPPKTPLWLYHSSSSFFFFNRVEKSKRVFYELYPSTRLDTFPFQAQIAA